MPCRDAAPMDLRWASGIHKPSDPGHTCVFAKALALRSNRARELLADADLRGVCDFDRNDRRRPVDPIDAFRAGDSAACSSEGSSAHGRGGRTVDRMEKPAAWVGLG